MPQGSFVFAVVGDRHLQIVEWALRFLKRVTRQEIIVVWSRSSYPLEHDQCIYIDVDQDFDDRAAAIYLKTNILRCIGNYNQIFCYIDSDIMAINSGIDNVFSHRSGVINFCADKSHVDKFSAWAVRCGCVGMPCGHLRHAIQDKFGVAVQADWRLFNGGLFLFDVDSSDFLDLWWSMCRQAIKDPFWKTRDQGALTAAVWKMQLNNADPLPAAYNFIVDCMSGMSMDQRANAQNHLLNYHSNYGLSASSEPFALHFINGGVGRVGWRNWDEAAALLATR